MWKDGTGLAEGSLTTLGGIVGARKVQGPFTALWAGVKIKTQETQYSNSDSENKSIFERWGLPCKIISYQKAQSSFKWPSILGHFQSLLIDLSLTHPELIILETSAPANGTSWHLQIADHPQCPYLLHYNSELLKLSKPPGELVKNTGGWAPP